MDNPIIENCERTGFPDGKEPWVPHCPVCGAECVTVYKSVGGYGLVYGCDVCLEEWDAWAEPKCFER